MDGVSSIEVSEKLAARGVFVLHGDFYALTVIERLGQAPHGLVRAGCACYTTAEEVDRLLARVRAATAYDNRFLFTGREYAATADFNRDGKPDYALFNPGKRQTAIWYLSGVTLIGGAYGPTLPVGWSFLGP
jgi:hypothetical protein